MPRTVKVAATQLEITRDPEKNLVRVGQPCLWPLAAVKRPRPAFLTYIRLPASL
jgi:hypothetical protein